VFVSIFSKLIQYITIIANHSGDKTLKKFKKFQAHSQLRHQRRSAVTDRICNLLEFSTDDKCQTGKRVESMRNTEHEMNVSYFSYNKYQSTGE